MQSMGRRWTHQQILKNVHRMHVADLNGDFSVTKHTNVRGLARGLQVLRALNAMESGRATSQQVSDAIGLHRTTVRRLLETIRRGVRSTQCVGRQLSPDARRPFAERRLHGRRTHCDHRPADHGSDVPASRVAIRPDDARRRRNGHPRDGAWVQSAIVSSVDGRPGHCQVDGEAAVK
ncbi:MAG: IclR family transcriptional regulator, mhp operon transcriptional activator [Caballeronia sp.]|nr:IclR family transcriptional regulator, mhp operon transcriptional activator [Caballeronia sp.]